MAQVSKRFLSKEVEERILDLFGASLSVLSSKEEVAKFLNDLLTPTEKIMLAKRLATVFMLMKNYDYKEINQVLKVSDPTIWNIKAGFLFKGEGYNLALKRIINEEKWEKFLPPWRK